MSTETENVLKTVIFFKKKDENDFETIMITFEAYFMRKNITHKRTMFHLRAECPKNVSQDSCEHDMNSQMVVTSPANNKKIKDRFNIGLQDKGFSERLQINSNLKLDKALEMARSYEQIRTQMKERQRLKKKRQRILNERGKLQKYSQIETRRKIYRKKPAT